MSSISILVTYSKIIYKQRVKIGHICRKRKIIRSMRLPHHDSRSTSHRITLTKWNSIAAIAFRTIKVIAET